MTSKVRGTTVGRNVMIGAAVLPLLLFVVHTFVLPHPYFIYGVDDSVFYFLGRAARSGSWLGASPHPAIPIAYAEALVLTATGEGISSAQTFVHLSHLLAAIATAGGMAYFAAKLLRAKESVIVAGALVAVIAWPPFLSGADYLGPDAVIAAVGLPTLTTLWLALGRGGNERQRLMLVHGFLVSTCLATKLTFIPLALSCFVVWAWMFFTAGREGSDRRGVLAAPLGLAIGTLWFVPVLPWLPDIFWVAVAVGRGGASNLTQMVEVLSYAVGAIPFYLAGAAILVWLVGRSGASTGISTERRGQRLLVLLLMFMFFVGVLTASHQLQWRDDPGIVFRYASPAALVFPFALLYLGSSTSPSRKKAPIWWVVPVSVLVFSLSLHFYLRQRRLDEETRTSDLVYARMEELAAPTGRIAFFPEVGAIAGEPAFFLRGNEMARAGYENNLAQALPRYAHFALDDAENTLHGDVVQQDGVLQSVRDAWHRLFGIEERLGEPPLITGLEGDDVALIAFPRNGEQALSEADLTALRGLVAPYVGDVNETREVIGDYEWVFWTPTES